MHERGSVGLGSRQSIEKEQSHSLLEMLWPLEFHRPAEETQLSGRCLQSSPPALTPSQAAGSL